MSGVTPNSSVAPPAAIAAPVLTSSKISGMPCCVRELAHALEVAVDRPHDVDVHHRRLEDQPGDLALELVQHALDARRRR